MDINKLVQGDDGLYKFLDAHGTPFWYAVFYSKYDALKSYYLWAGKDFKEVGNHVTTIEKTSHEI